MATPQIPAAPNDVYFCSPDEMARQQAAGLRNPLPVVGNVPAPIVERPKAARDLYATARATLLAAVGNTQTLIPPAPGFTALPGYDGVLKELWLTVIAPVVGMEVRFTLLLDTGPVEGWTGFCPIAAAGGFSSMVIRGPFPFTERQALTVRAVNVAGTGPHDVQVDLFGYQYSYSSRRAIYGDAPGV